MKENFVKIPEDFFRQKAIKKLRKSASGDTYTIILIQIIQFANGATIRSHQFNELMKYLKQSKENLSEDDVRYVIDFAFRFSFIDYLPF